MMIKQMGLKDVRRDDVLTARLSSLTFGNAGTMSYQLSHPTPGIALVAFEGQSPVGWAILNRHWEDFPYPNKHIWKYRQMVALWVFVDPERRTRGIGGKLVCAAKSLARRQHRALACFPHDEASEHLYKTLRNKRYMCFTSIEWRNPRQERALAG